MSVFIVRHKARKEGYDILNTLGVPPARGEVGIEIEVEGASLPKNNEDLRPYWGYHIDHSLRGEDNAEYVLNKPILFSEVPKALDDLWKVFEKSNARLDESNRTSIHVHLNCQSFHLNRVAAFSALWFCVEEILTEFCGSHRVGNLFCLRGKDAPAIVTSLKKFLKNDGRTELRDGLHYAGFNTNALYKFGSIEIRTMRGVRDKKVIQDWVSILERIWRLSEEYTDPRDIPPMMSYEGSSEFLRKVLGDKTDMVLSSINMTDEEVRDSLYEGVRIAQDICYCRDWSEYFPVVLKADPFGRRKKNTPGTSAPIPTTMDAFLDSIASTPTFNSSFISTQAGSYVMNHFSPALPEPEFETEPDIDIDIDDSWMDDIDPDSEEEE